MRVSGNSHKCFRTIKPLELLLPLCWGSFFEVLNGNMWILGPSTPLLRMSIHSDFSFDPRVFPSCPASSPTPIPTITIPFPSLWQFPPQGGTSPTEGDLVHICGWLSVCLGSTLGSHLLLNSQRMPGSARVPPPPTLVQHGNFFQMLRY